MAHNTQHHTFQAFGQTFHVDADYEFVRELGQGEHGYVVELKHRRSGKGCAVKKIANINSKRGFVKRCLREIRLLHHFRGHENITSLYDLDIVLGPAGNFNEVYVYEELMEADLHAIIRSGQSLSDLHFQYFLYQALRGLKYIHSANVIHRDIRPVNLLVNADCELKICDFGLARGYTPAGSTVPPSKAAGGQGFMTEYVAMRWYRAPEIMLSFANYNTAIDMWSIGCVLAELLGGKPIFRGKDYADQLNQILNCLGTPSEDTIGSVGSPRAQDYIRSLPIKPRIPFSSLYPNATPQAIDMLSRMLTFDPAKRISCEEALNHPYLAAYHDPIDEPLCSSKFDFTFEEEESMGGMKKMIVDEVNTFRSLVRAQAGSTKQETPQDPLPVPSREELIPSPVSTTAPEGGITSSSSHSPHDITAMRPGSPIINESSEQLERKLAGMHLNQDIPQDVTDKTVSPLANETVTPGDTTSSAYDTSNTATMSPQDPTSASTPITLSNDITGSVSIEGGTLIGFGGFGDLFLGVHQTHGKVALKKPRRLLNEALVRRFLREVDLWCSVSHRYILPCLGMCKIGFDTYVVSPFIQNGDLLSCMAKGMALNRTKLLYEVAEALAHLHHRGILHGDVKAQNILLADDGSALLCDFGLASAFDSMVTSTESKGAGSVRWMAPELFHDERRSMASDVYSLGITISEVLSGHAPYPNITSNVIVMRHVADKGGRPPRQPLSSPEGVSYATLWDTAEKCWAEDPKARPYMVQVLAMLFPLTREMD